VYPRAPAAATPEGRRVSGWSSLAAEGRKEDIVRSTLCCPKCKNNRILYITQVADRIGDLGGIDMEEGTKPAPEGGQYLPWRLVRFPNPKPGFFASNLVGAGLVEAFVCKGCGYTELYTKDAAQIPVDGEHVRELEGPEPQGPYR
jgi:predicted nucleic-acid-binding Zn-ribbon protein